MTTEEFISKYLHENLIESETLSRMKGVISEFAARAPKILVTKCIDGRVHGSKAKGYPATTIRFGHADGNIVSMDKSNFWFWNRIDNIVNNAICNTPNIPALYIAYMHRSDMGFGCAAHNNNEDTAYRAINEQSRSIKKLFSQDRLYVLEGITNTDSMAETLIFDETIHISTEEIIKDFQFESLDDIFHRGFLKYPIKDPSTSRYINFKTPEELMGGDSPLFHSDFQTSLSMKSYLLMEITRIITEEDHHSQKLVQSDLFNAILSLLKRVSSLPQSLMAPIFYQSFWNISYALYRKIQLKSLSEEERLKHLDHEEELICYGDGFELLPRNKAVLVKTGRGDDSNALTVAKTVLEANRKKKNPSYSPVIHINIEISGEQMSWEDFNENVTAKLHTMHRHIDDVFSSEINILTTYSYRHRKRFYPIKTLDDPRINYPVNLLDGLNSDLSFSNMSLKSREAIYTTERVSSSSVILF